MIELEDVRAAARRLEGVVHRTPVLTSATLDAAVGATAFLKAEHLQRGGAFKFRGAYHRISEVADGDSASGVVAFSSGNHAQAVALAARTLGLSAVLVMPADAPPEKLAATRGYGGEVVTFDRVRDDRKAIAERIAHERGLVLVPPYDDPMVMAGQGTAAIELVEQVDVLDVLIVPVGGGGLISGCATVARALLPDAQVIGVEPATADDTRRSLERGERVLIEPPETIADGLQVDSPGELTFEVIRRRVDRIVTVTEAQIVDAMRFLFERVKAVVEPSGAVGVAALLSGSLDVRGRRAGVIVSGGNVGADRFASLIRSA